MSGARIAAAALLVLACTAGLAASFGMWRWRSTTDQAITDVLDIRQSWPSARYDARDIAALPPPVVRYFHRVLRDGQPLIARARIAHEGTFNSSETEERWSPFRSVEVFSVQPPAFIWDARIDMWHMPVLVLDSYVGGRGRMHGALYGLMPVVDAGGTPEMAAGALQRYLAETPWFPTALLPSGGVVWTAIDDRRALATLTDPGPDGASPISVSLEFRFSERGDVEEVYTPGRYRQVGQTALLTPWSGVNRDFMAWDGIRIPTAAEVRWHLPDRVLPYWRGRVLDVEYEWVPDEDSALR